ncbi:MAG: septal ring lytic transglycosylase RlpA family protein [Archangium sp.]
MLALVVGLTGCRTTRGSGDGLGEGLASFYGKGLDGRPTASGETFDKEAFTAAHRTLSFGSCVLVTVIKTGATVEVRVNDRGPFVAGRIIDVSEAAARKLGIIDSGVARVMLRRCD